MKTIESVKAINLKGLNFSYDLHPVTAITGDNASGKSAILNAIQVGLLGYVPSLGRQPGKTIGLAPDEAKIMDIGLSFSDGTVCQRSFKRTATGASASDQGSQDFCTSSQLDFSEFINAKPTERHQILSSLMGSVDSKQLQQELTRKIAELGLGQFGFIIEKSEGNPLSPLVSKVGEQGKFVKQEVDKSRKTLATLVESEIPDPVDTDKLIAAKTAHETAIREITTAQLMFDDIMRRHDRPEPTKPQRVEPTEDQMSEADDRCATADALIIEVTNKISDSENELATAQRKLGSATATLESLKSRNIQVTKPECQEPDDGMLEELESKVKIAQEELFDLTAKGNELMQNIRRFQSSIETIENQKKCPCCGSEGDHLKVALDSLKESLAESQFGLVFGASEAGIADGELAKLKIDLQGKLAARSQWDEYKHGIKSIPTLEELHQATETESDCLAIIKTLRVKIDNLKAESESLRNVEKEVDAMAMNQQRWESYRRQMKEIPTPKEVEATKIKLAESTKKQELTQYALENMQTELDAYNRAVSDQQRINDLKRSADENEGIAKNLKSLKDWLQAKEREATKIAMGPVLDVAGVFLDGIVSGTLAIRKHEVGIDRNGQFLPLEVLSGMEMAAVAAACQAAMASSSLLRIVIVDELGRMRDDQAHKFIENCQRAVETGVVDQVIIADPHDRHSKDITINLG